MQLNRQKIFSKYRVFIAMICSISLGSVIPLVKVCYGLFNNTNNGYFPVLFVGMRFVISGVAMYFIGNYYEQDNKLLFNLLKNKYIILLIFIGILTQICFYVGMTNTSGGKSAVLNSFSVFINVILVYIFNRNEKIMKSKILGVVFGIVGTTLICFDGIKLDEFSFLGEGLVLLSAIGYAVDPIIMKKVSSNNNIIKVFSITLICQGIVLTGIGIYNRGYLVNYSILGCLIFFCLILISVITWSIRGLLIKYNDVEKIIIFDSLIPIVGMILSGFLLNESIFTIKKVFSLMLIAFAIYQVQKQKNDL